MKKMKMNTETISDNLKTEHSKKLLYSTLIVKYKDNIRK